MLFLAPILTTTASNGTTSKKSIKCFISEHLQFKKICCFEVKKKKGVIRSTSNIYCNFVISVVRFMIIFCL